MEENELLRRLEEHPETWRTLLGSNYGHNSLTVLIRRKVLRNIKCGLVQRIFLNGTRGGEVLYVHRDRKYQFVITAEHRDFHYYSCSSTTEKDKSTIVLHKPEELVDGAWVKMTEDIEIFIGSVVKIL